MPPKKSNKRNKEEEEEEDDEKTVAGPTPEQLQELEDVLEPFAALKRYYEDAEFRRQCQDECSRQMRRRMKKQMNSNRRKATKAPEASERRIGSLCDQFKHSLGLLDGINFPTSSVPTSSAPSTSSDKKLENPTSSEPTNEKVDPELVRIVWDSLGRPLSQKQVDEIPGLMFQNWSSRLKKAEYLAVVKKMLKLNVTDYVNKKDIRSWIVLVDELRPGFTRLYNYAMHDEPMRKEIWNIIKDTKYQGRSVKPPEPNFDFWRPETIPPLPRLTPETAYPSLHVSAEEREKRNELRKFVEEQGPDNVVFYLRALYGPKLTFGKQSK